MDWFWNAWGSYWPVPFLGVGLLALSRLRRATLALRTALGVLASIILGGSLLYIAIALYVSWSLSRLSQ
jgi:hypothetical protein